MKKAPEELSRGKKWQREEMKNNWEEKHTGWLRNGETMVERGKTEAKRKEL